MSASPSLAPAGAPPPTLSDLPEDLLLLIMRWVVE